MDLITMMLVANLHSQQQTDLINIIAMQQAAAAAVTSTTTTRKGTPTPTPLQAPAGLTTYGDKK